MIEHNYKNLKVKQLLLNHINHDGEQTIMECPYLKEDVARMLLHYRKENKKKMLLDRDKPIEW